LLPETGFSAGSRIIRVRSPEKTNLSTPIRSKNSDSMLKERPMALEVGQIAPDFCLDSHTGQSVRLSEYRGQRNVVLAFFPLAWTPV
jgi:hypothetical protein